jgi:hypothetical protein
MEYEQKLEAVLLATLLDDESKYQTLMGVQEFTHLVKFLTKSHNEGGVYFTCPLFGLVFLSFTKRFVIV